MMSGRKSYLVVSIRIGSAKHSPRFSYLDLPADYGANRLDIVKTYRPYPHTRTFRNLAAIIMGKYSLGPGTHLRLPRSCEPQENLQGRPDPSIVESFVDRAHTGRGS